MLVDSPPTLDTTASYTLMPEQHRCHRRRTATRRTGRAGTSTTRTSSTITAARLAELGFDFGRWKVAAERRRVAQLAGEAVSVCGSRWIRIRLWTSSTTAQTTTVTYTQSLAVNDNTYGTNTDPSWGGKTHTFSNLTGSDKAEFRFTNGNGAGRVGLRHRLPERHDHSAVLRPRSARAGATARSSQRRARSPVRRHWPRT